MGPQGYVQLGKNYVQLARRFSLEGLESHSDESHGPSHPVLKEGPSTINRPDVEGLLQAAIPTLMRMIVGMLAG